jgi:hypothetical protein
MNQVDEYLQLATKWGEALENGDSDAANVLYDRIQGLFQHLCDAKQEEALFGKAEFVRDAACLFIASHLKDRDPSRAMRLYQRLTQSDLPFVSLSAKHALIDLT